MSKSVGNVVNPFKTIETYGTDAARYFLARVGGRFKYDVGTSRPLTRCETTLTMTPRLLGRLVKNAIRQTQRGVDVPRWKLLF